MRKSLVRHESPIVSAGARVARHPTVRAVATLALVLLMVTPAGSQVLSVRHLAGPLGGAGTRDGAGSAARFNTPLGAAVNAAGTTVYVADSNHTIRRVNVATGTVTTVAGLAGYTGGADGVGSAARFDIPLDVEMDAAGTTVFLTNSENCTIRSLDVATSTVTTLAGRSYVPGSADGVGSAARFSYPVGIAVDAAGTVVFVTDGNYTVRRFDVSTGAVTTVAGLAGNAGSADGIGTEARFRTLRGAAVDAAGTALFVADSGNHTLRRFDVATGTVTTVAGLAGNAGSADGVGSEARFNYPAGVAVDAAGTTVYVTDGNDTIRRFDVATGTVTTVAGLAGVSGSADGVGSAARFDYPGGAAVDPAGTTVYLTDRNNHTIRRLDAATQAVTTVAGLAPAESGSTDGIGSAARFHNPTGVAVDASGTTVHVADTYNHVIRRVDAATRTVTTVAGLAGASGRADGVGSAARFSFPVGVAVNAAGTTVWVTDSNNVIRRVDVASGTVTTVAGGFGTGSTDGIGSAARFFNPTGAAVDAAGTTVYVTDTNNYTLRRLDVATGAVTTVAGLAGNHGSADGVGTAARFFAPRGVAINAAGTVVYVADTGNYTIRRLDVATGTVTTVAGLAGTIGHADGVGTAARFGSPRSVAVDAAGTTLFVADYGNHTIRRIDVATEAVTTVAGSVSGVLGTEDGVGRAAGFNYPCAVAVDAGGRRVIVADSSNDGIRAGAPVSGSAGDHDGDGWSDVAVYRPSTGTWFSLDSSAGWQTYRFRGWGVEAHGDTPVRGDFDGDGVIDPTVYRPASGTWFVLKSSSDFTDWIWFGWGEVDDQLVPGDYDGDGMTEAAVYRASDKTWFIRPSSGAPVWSMVFGEADDVPLPGDYDGDGRTDICVYRPSTGTWFVLTSSSSFTSWWYEGWGVDTQGDTPAPGDFDGDGKTDLCVFRPGSGTWFILKSSTNNSGWMWFGWGQAGDVVVPGDYDGDGVTDAAVYRPSTGVWYMRPSSGLTPWSVMFGQSGDVPLRGVR